MKSLIPWKNSTHTAIPSLWDDDWFDRVWENPFRGLLAPVTKTFSSQMPSVDVTDDKKEVTVRVEVPGMTEKDLDLTWHDGVLRIRGEKRDEKEEKKNGRTYRECRYGSFSRDIPLGDTVEWSGAKAHYKNGVLTVKMPKTENARKAIEIKVN